MKKIMIVFGTRPDAIKMVPLIKELEKNREFEVKICSTGQHKEMLDQVLEMFNIKPDFNLNVMKKNQTLEDITSSIILKTKQVFLTYVPDIVLVHGDTTTGLAVALESYYNKIKVAHVEAGLRTFDKYSPFPEEMNRKLIASIADYHFAPTESNKKNLLREGIDENKIIVTGNTVIDLIKYTVEEGYVFEENKLNEINYYENKVILVTAHRRENLENGIDNICNAIKIIAKKYTNVKFVFPVHLNPKIQDKVFKNLKDNNNVILTNPLNVKELHNLINKCYLVATDSGGIQEEAPSLGKPVLVLRNETERQEAIDASTVRMIGTDTNNIVKEMSKLIDNKIEYQKMANTVNPYGDGNASKRIVEFLKKLSTED